MQNPLQAIRANVSSVLIGQESVTDLLLTALLAGGHGQNRDGTHFGPLCLR